jgi:hypothetical protein
MQPKLKTASFCLLLLLAFTTKAQVNLVPNPSFEDTVNCPAQGGQINYSQSWSSPSFATPDLFHSCSSNTSLNTPANAYGMQPPKSGFAYAGIITYYDNNSNYSEYIQTKLSSPLIEGTQYCISFYVNIADSSSYYSNDIGFYISGYPVFYNTSQSFTINPTATNSDVILNSKIEWKRIAFQYTSKGGEEYLVIGNFKNNIETEASETDGATWVNGVYLYIDDVSVSPGSCFTSLIEETYSKIKFYPNPVLGNRLNIEGSFLDKDEIKLFTGTGMECEMSIYWDIIGTVVTFSDLTNGIYYLEIRGKKIHQTNLLIINN